MAYSKVILNGTTLMDVTQKTVTAGDMLSGTTALKNDGTDITGSIASKSSSDLAASGATVTAPAGYYASNATKSVASGTAGTPTASKGAVSNHSVSVTPSVTNTTGFITGDTKTGTAVTVSASELVSGTLSISSNDTYDVTNYASASVLVPSTAPNIQSLSITSNGTYTASGGIDGYSPITVNVSGGGGGSYPWFGPNTVKDYTKTITINLSEDTSWDSWTASTTATSILAAPSTNDFTYAFDIDSYAVFIVTTAVTNYVHKSTATKANIPISSGRFDFCVFYGQPSSYSDYKTLTINTRGSTGSWNALRLYYYNSNSTKAVYATNYGAYASSNPTFSDSASGSTVTIGGKRSPIYARCNATYFATARKADIDAENTNVVITFDVYKTPRENAFMPNIFDGMIMAMNLAPEA